MVKFKTGNKIVLGLSEENIKRLQKDEPIKFNLKELGLDDIDVFIITGKNEHTIAKQIAEAAKIDLSKTVFTDSRAKEN